MAGRTVGKGRSVTVAGVRYDEGAEIPKDVEVGEHVFTDSADLTGNPTHVPPRVVTADGPVEATSDDGGSTAAAAPAKRTSKRAAKS